MEKRSFGDFEQAVLEEAKRKEPYLDINVDFDISREIRYYYDRDEFDEAVEALIDYAFEQQEQYY